MRMRPNSRVLAGVTALVALTAVPPAHASAPAHDTFVQQIDDRGNVSGTCVEVAIDGFRDCSVVSFTIGEGDPWVFSSDGSCGATFPAALTIWTSAFGGVEVTIPGTLSVYRGAGTFTGQTNPAHAGGIVAYADLAYVGRACAADDAPYWTLLTGTADIVTMIPI